MSSSSSKPESIAPSQPADLETLQAMASTCGEVVRFLLTPFLSEPQALRIDCETFPSHQRVWVRVAFAEGDRGRAFGRHGKTLQAIRTVVETTARLGGLNAHLEVYGESERGSSSSRPRRSNGPPRRRSKPVPRNASDS